MATGDRWSGGRAHLQVGPWRGQDDVVVMSPVPARPHPSSREIREQVALLAERGTKRVHTGALHHGEVGAFLDAGFEVHDRLHLLRHDLRVLPAISPRVRLRRAWRRDRAPILAIDARAFDEFWALDRSGLDDAMRATPVSRFRVAADDGVIGYAITGRAANRGYIQRLAVDPDRHRGGHGSALVADGLRWLHRTGAGSAVVNTQEGNEGALALYLSLGFEREPSGLTVLSLDVQAAR